MNNCPDFRVWKYPILNTCVYFLGKPKPRFKHLSRLSSMSMLSRISWYSKTQFWTTVHTFPAWQDPVLSPSQYYLRLSTHSFAHCLDFSWHDETQYKTSVYIFSAYWNPVLSICTEFLGILRSSFEYLSILSEYWNPLSDFISMLRPSFDNLT